MSATTGALSILTVQSDLAVVVRPVIDGPDARVDRYERQSTADWYRGQRFTFLVYDAALPLVNATVATATFGRPARTYAVGLYRVLVWDHPISISPVGTST